MNAQRDGAKNQEVVPTDIEIAPKNQNTR